ncbi:MAG TPA: MGMT family protein [Candidatus Saccharimonadales bacterium]|nr:MGMT family protein [Candidatus Saccharimonadales bacterium]
MSQFKERVINVIRQIPRGKVVSYGQVAAYVGMPRAARQIGWTMSKLGNVDLPWWRVVNNAGKITFRGSLYNDKALQKKLLEAEGIPVADDYTFDIEKYRFSPNPKQLQKMELDEA